MKTFITMLVAAAVSLAVVRAADQESVGEKASVPEVGAAAVVARAEEVRRDHRG